MKKRIHVVMASVVFLAGLLLPAVSSAEVTVPVIVTLTSLDQLGDVETPATDLGDFYPEVYINGVRHTNSSYSCDNSPPQGYILPTNMFSGTSSAWNCANTPWQFAVDLPLSLFRADINTPEDIPTIPIRIEIWDSDLIDDDIEEDVDLRIPLNGRWSGDKNWPENCSRPFACCSGVRVCWDIQVGPDSDGDGLFDAWETAGIDTDAGHLDLPGMGANPNHKDIFVELDWRPGFAPKRIEVLKWKQAFAAAPINAGGIANPDGLPGINLHVDTGSLTEGGVLVGDNLGGGNALAATFPVCSFDGAVPPAFAAAKAANFNDGLRGLAFRYGITTTNCCMFGTNFGLPCTLDSQCNGAICQNQGGQAEIGGNDFVVWNFDTFQGSTLMHELGHTLNLRHGGDVDDNCKPNYLSVMNYDHFELQRKDASAVIDYSPPRKINGTRGAAPLPTPDGTLDENHLDETRILDPSDQDTFLAYTDALGTKRLSLVGQRVDWDGNPNTTSTDIPVNIDNANVANNYPAKCANNVLKPALTGHDDWANLSLPFLQFGESADGPTTIVPDPEPNQLEILASRRVLNATDLNLAHTGSAGPFEAGTTANLSYNLVVTNQGPNPALPPKIIDTLPPGAVVASPPSGCVVAPPGQITCTLSSLLAGETANIPLSLRAPATCVNGVLQPIVNQALLFNANEFAGPDPDGSDNSRQFSSTVVDTTAPTVRITSPSQDQTGTWPITNTINVAFSASDTAGGIAREVIKLQGCTIYDGDTEGDRDGLLSDEYIQLSKPKWCQFMTKCRFTTLEYPTLTVESTDACGGNTGSAQRILRRRIQKSEVCR